MSFLIPVSRQTYEHQPCLETHVIAHTRQHKDMDLNEQKIIHADRFYLLHTTCVKHVEQDEEFMLVVFFFCFLF